MIDLHSDIVHAIIKKRITLEDYMKIEKNHTIVDTLFNPQEVDDPINYFKDLLRIKTKIEEIKPKSRFSIENISCPKIFEKILNLKKIEYLSLCHNYSNEYCDSSTDKEKNNGLSQAGREVVKLANTNNIKIDISHASEKSALDIIR